MHWIHVNRNAPTSVVIIPGWALLPSYFQDWAPHCNVYILHPFVDPSMRSDYLNTCHPSASEITAPLTTILARCDRMITVSMGLHWVRHHHPKWPPIPCHIVSPATQYHPALVAPLRRGMLTSSATALRAFYRQCMANSPHWSWWKHHHLDTHTTYLSIPLLMDWLDTHATQSVTIPNDPTVTVVMDPRDPIGVRPEESATTGYRTITHSQGHLFPPDQYRAITQPASRDPFDEAATTYHKAATIQDITARWLMTTIDRDWQNTHPSPPDRVLDIGCGTGHLSRLLATTYPTAHIDALDRAPAMLDQIRTLPHANIHPICADYASFVPPYPYHLIASNAALHWLPIDHALATIHRQLHPHGRCYATIYGRETSHELRRLLPMIGREPTLPATRFASFADIHRYLWGSPMTWTVCRRQWTIPFPSVRALLKTQKDTGVARSVTPQGLWTPRQLASLEQAFLDHYGQVQLTYDVYRCRGWHP